MEVFAVDKGAAANAVNGINENVIAPIRIVRLVFRLNLIMPQDGKTQILLI